MSSRNRADKEREKQIQDRLQLLMTQMLKDDDNKYCVDCDAKGPRWVSWNLGIFLCIRCAGIHRNLGVHISRVKSVNLDSWTPLQVASVQLMGNSRARAVYEANLPDTFTRPQSDQALEQFIRAKYEKKKYIAKEYVPQKCPEFPDGWYELIEAEKQKKDVRKLVLPSHGGSPSKTKATSSSTTSSTVKSPTASVKPSIPSAQAIKSTSSSLPTPKPTSAASSASAKKTVNNASDDLLGLSLGSGGGGNINNLDILGGGGTSSTNSAADFSNNNNDFADFTSAPSSSTTNGGETKNGKSKEEDDFFNAASTTTTNSTAAAADGKMTKDSIMALFGKQQQPSASTGMMGNAGGVAPQQPGFGANPQSNPFLQQQQQPSMFNQSNVSAMDKQFAGLDFGTFGGLQQNPSSNSNNGVLSNQQNAANNAFASFGNFGNGKPASGMPAAIQPPSAASAVVGITPQKAGGSSGSSNQADLLGLW